MYTARVSRFGYGSGYRLLRTEVAGRTRGCSGMREARAHNIYPTERSEGGAEHPAPRKALKKVDAMRRGPK
jgi:hypothetical protein